MRPFAVCGLHLWLALVADSDCLFPAPPTPHPRPTKRVCVCVWSFNASLTQRGRPERPARELRHCEAGSRCPSRAVDLRSLSDLCHYRAATSRFAPFGRTPRAGPDRRAKQAKAVTMPKVQRCRDGGRAAPGQAGQGPRRDAIVRPTLLSATSRAGKNEVKLFCLSDPIFLRSGPCRSKPPKPPCTSHVHLQLVGHPAAPPAPGSAPGSSAAGCSPAGAAASAWTAASISDQRRHSSVAVGA
jgi:hypothetical protein